MGSKGLDDMPTEEPLLPMGSRGEGLGHLPTGSAGSRHDVAICEAAQVKQHDDCRVTDLGAEKPSGVLEGGGDEHTLPRVERGRIAEQDSPRAGESIGEDGGRRGAARCVSELEGSDAAALRVAPRVENSTVSRRPCVLGAQATFDDDSWWE